MALCRRDDPDSPPILGTTSVGLLVTLVQFPLYAVIVTLVNGARRRVIVLLLVIVFHVLAASLAVYDYCQSRRRCELESSSNPWTLAQTNGLFMNDERRVPCEYDQAVILSPA